MAKPTTIAQPTSTWCNLFGFDPDALLKELAPGKSMLSNRPKETA
jgi:hypothetical protein